MADRMQSCPYNETHELKQILEKEFTKTVRIYPFGSRIMGIGQESSDLDIYVEIGTFIRTCI